MKQYAELARGIKDSSNQELSTLISLCLGRVLRMGSRPEKPGDGEEYDKYSWLAKEASRELAERGRP